MQNRAFRYGFLAVLLLLSTLAFAQQSPVEKAVDDIRARLTSTLNRDQLLNLDLAAVDKVVTPDERRVLATEFWSFDANIPTVVSVMRDVQQKDVPWWLPESGFAKTDLRVRNSEYEYEVWQKRFDAGHVGLGINGLDGHRPPYFVCVAPQDPAAKLTLSNFNPAKQEVLEMRPGSLVYHDWTELVLTEVPEALKGQQLLPTIRGRASESHIVGGFRETASPSSDEPDQIMLTWTDDPKTTQTVQWRTNPSIEEGLVRYREKGADAWNEAKAERSTLTDRLILNAPIVNRFTATLRDLKPATTYDYTVGSDETRSESFTFTTAPAGASPFTFLVLSDTHNKPETGQLLNTAQQKYPDAAFLLISGDLVGTGQHRDDYDQLFVETAAFGRAHPIMPALGNHDTIGGLGCDVYLSLFALPTNGSPAIPKEQSYSFRYGDALFIVLDSMSPEKAQAPWLEEQLKNTDAKWKFVQFHFPPYSLDEDVYADMLESWIPLFDRYGVDMVFTGHVHYYQRTVPMRAGKPAPDGKGTVYMISVAVNHRADHGGLKEKPDFVAVLDPKPDPDFLAVTVNGNRTTLRAQYATGEVFDEFSIEKP
jgi:hypothetical protein